MMSNLLKRVRSILGANAHSMVDRFEEPESMLRQAIREMEASIHEATAAAAKSIASETILARQRTEHAGQAERWQTRAEAAVVAGNDELAREALSQKLRHESTATAIGEQASFALTSSERLRRQIEAMKARHAEARRKLAALVARQKAAEVQKAYHGATTVFALDAQGFDRFEQIRENVELAEAEAVALMELDRGAALSDEAVLEAREDERRIDAELAALKQKARQASSASDPGELR